MPRPWWKSPRAVVPPRVHAIVGVLLTEDIDESPRFQGGQAVAFGLADVRRADELGRVVYVAIVGSDVVVATHDHLA